MATFVYEGDFLVCPSHHAKKTNFIDVLVVLCPLFEVIQLDILLNVPPSSSCRNGVLEPCPLPFTSVGTYTSLWVREVQ